MLSSAPSPKSPVFILEYEVQPGKEFISEPLSESKVRGVFCAISTPSAVLILVAFSLCLDSLLGCKLPQSRHHVDLPVDDPQFLTGSLPDRRLSVNTSGLKV